MLVQWFNHTGLVVSNMEHSLVFYRDVLGLTEERNEIIEGQMISQLTGFKNTRMHVAYLGIGDMRHSIELVQYLEPPNNPPVAVPRNSVGVAHIGAIVEDLDKIYAQLNQMGLTFVSPPAVRPNATYPWARKACFLNDPDGYLIELIERQSPPPGATSV
ncbi:MAG: VOC family protein [Chloroflexota bacterium]|nr:VOC family protein [Chloroflexota bacterium]